ncbi:MAG TPA: hypothetical protein VJS66_09320 [Burkholderiales bacterium]|nr:hypothetical protein [Burkholderiales bacterium]
MARTNAQNASQYAAAAVRRIGRVVIAFGLLALAPIAGAGELSILINGWAKHLDERQGVKFNERNWGGGFQYDYEPVNEHWIPFVNASGFKDSDRNMSYYAGGGVMRRFKVAPELDNLYVDAGVIAFVMTRKNYKDNDPFLGALPAFSIGTDHVAVNITYVPKVDPKSVPLWFFQFKVPFSTY